MCESLRRSWVVVPTPYAILDLHFAHRNASVLAVSTSSGSIETFNMQLGAQPEIVKGRSFQICDRSVLVLAFAWSPVSHPSKQMIAFSLSSGHVGILRWSDPDSTIQMVKGHSLEAWTVAVSPCLVNEDQLYLYAGGDDLHFWKARLVLDEAYSGEDLLEPENVILNCGSDKKTHDAGITAILPLSVMSEQGKEEIVLTGSYDEHVRLLVLKDDSRRSVVLAEKRLGGGVWRLKILERLQTPQVPANETVASNAITNNHLSIRVLASCMHAGVRVLELCRSRRGDWSIRVLAQFLEHESMNYASDARKSLTNEEAGMTIVSTSFYDRRLCIWTMANS